MSLISVIQILFPRTNEISSPSGEKSGETPFINFLVELFEKEKIEIIESS